MKRLPCCIVAALVAVMCARACAETVVVNSASLEKSEWAVAQQVGKEVRLPDDSLRPAEAVAELVRGYGTPPSGSGSLHLYVGSGESDPLPKVYVGTNRYAGIKLAAITQFSFWVCPRWWCYKGAQPVTIEIATSKNGNLRLFTFYPWGYEPSGYYTRGVWREIDLMGVGGSWEMTNVDSSDSKGNWNWLINRYPDMTIAVPPPQDWPSGTLPGTGVNIKIGAGQAVEPSHLGGAWWRESSGCNAYVDKLTVGYLDATGQEVVTTYDFEADE